MVTISIIIPIYNCAQYLSRCINSILAQTYSDFELILVNDGSTDESAIICDEYAKKDSRIITFHKDNEGVSSARNAGLRIASGKYISFIDADDSIDKQFLFTLISKDIDVDLIICGYTEIDSTSNIVKNQLYNIPSKQIYKFSEIIKYILSSTYTNSNLTNSCWNKIYKKSIIDDNNLLFANRKRGEDWLFNIEYLQVIDTAIYHNIPLYKYHRNNTSAMSHLHENQISLWIENRIIRQDLIDKYELSINEKLYNTVWIKKVLYYIFELFGKKVPKRRVLIHKILSNSIFLNALSCSHIESYISNPILFLTRLQWFDLCYCFLRLLYNIKQIIKIDKA